MKKNTAVISENVRIVRSALSLSQQKLADSTNEGLEKGHKPYTKDMIFNYERGTTYPDIFFIKKLSELSGLTTAILQNKKIAAVDIKTMSLEVQEPVGVVLETLVQMYSKINILFSSKAHEIAKITGQKPDEVLLEMDEAARKEANNLFDELQQRNKGV